MAESWKIVKNTEGKVYKKGGYGLGWMIFPNKHEHGYCRNQSKTVFHTGERCQCQSELKGNKRGAVKKSGTGGKGKGRTCFIGCSYKLRNRNLYAVVKIVAANLYGYYNYSEPL